jgi:hypothetical protein
MTIDALPDSKVLKSPGPLERLFASSSSAACILDFMILAAQKGQYYSESEIALYSGVSPKNAKATISNLQRMGLVKERVTTMVTAGKKRRKDKAYAFRDEDNSSSLSKALANLVLVLTDKAVKGHTSTAIESTTGQDQVGDVVGELIEAGIIKLTDNGRPPLLDDNK